MPATSTVLAAVFSSNEQAERAIADLKRLGLGEAKLIGAANAPAGGDLAKTLLSQGLPEGQARWYSAESDAGRAVILISADGHTSDARAYVLAHGGYDVASQGAELAGGNQASADTGQVAPPPRMVTRRWADVSSRYEMLFAQRFGATDATWPEYEPAYRWAWDMATSEGFAGRAWQDVATEVEKAWSDARVGLPWSDVADVMRDVWTDIAEEAGTIGEGGAAALQAKPLDVSGRPGTPQS